jgi:CO/xanthine dehydrogenase Mo-binding subunit
VVCNKQKAQAYRAPGQPQACFAVESTMDELAVELGLDPIDLRLKNAVNEGDRMANGVRHSRFGCREVEEAMKAHPHYSAPLGGPNRGRGIAVAFRAQGGQTSSATINVNSNGTINLITGSVDIGGTRTAVAMQVAEVLGLSSEDVNPSVGDTDSVGYTANTGGSRTAFDTGLAAIAAAEEVIRRMKARASLIWEVQEEDVDFKDGVFICTKNPEDRFTFVQGIGWALNEEYFYTSDGTMANSSFLDYRMPTSLDVPMIEPVIIEVPNPRHPFGLRGVGEGPIIPPLAALANAVSHATRVRMRKLPLSPTNIMEAIEASKG